MWQLCEAYESAYVAIMWRLCGGRILHGPRQQHGKQARYHIVNATYIDFQMSQEIARPGIFQVLLLLMWHLCETYVGLMRRQNPARAATAQTRADQLTRCSLFSFAAMQSAEPQCNID